MKIIAISHVLVVEADFEVWRTKTYQNSLNKETNLKVRLNLLQILVKNLQGY